MNEVEFVTDAIDSHKFGICLLSNFGIDRLRFNSLSRLLFLPAGSLTSRVLALRSPFARHSAFGGSLFSVLLRMNAQIVP
jgi:hypothetical protein